MLTFRREDGEDAETWFLWSRRWDASSSPGTYSFSGYSSPQTTWAFIKAIRHVSKVERFQGELTGNRTSIAARKAGYRAQTKRVFARVNLVFHTYLI